MKGTLAHVQIIVTLAVAAAVLMAACAPAATPAPAVATSPPAPPPQAPPTPKPAAAQPTSKPQPAAKPGSPTAAPKPTGETAKLGGQTVLAQHVDLLNTDPLLCASTSCVIVVGQSFNKLLMRDKENGIVPDLAESWEQPDNLTYIVRLRKGARFHDGQEVKAEDVLYSVDLLKDRAAHPTYYAVWHAFASARSVDDYTIEFKTTQPDPTFTHALSHSHQYIVPKKSYTRSGAFTQQWVGTGPFKLAGFTRNVNYRLAKNADYFEKGIPYVDGINIVVIPDLAARIASFRTRRIDYIGELRTPDLLNLRRAVPELREIKVPGGAIGLFFNPYAPPFDNMKLRQAVTAGFQRQEIIDIVTQGTGILSGPLYGGPPGWGLAWFPEELKKLYAYDPNRVKTLLAEAGHPNGFSFTAKGTPRQPLAVAALEVVQQQLVKVNIKMQPEILDFTTFISQRDNLQFAAVSHIVTPGIEPAERFYFHFHSKNNRYGNDPEIDKLLDEQYRILDPEKRRQTLVESERLVIERGYGSGTYFQQFDFSAAQPYLKNYSSPSLTGQYLMRYAWLDK
ncbi:MAG: ABC transporter substrate-binding protein [Chloroflexi bacterium]|nr:ABC transporter substrate-binding protein [Chloroflexota bacterium]